MADDFDHLAQLLQQSATVTPDTQAKKEAISKAMAAFEKKYASSSQGIGLGGRLTSAANRLRHMLRGETTMKNSYLLAGAAFASVAIFTLVSTTQLTPPPEVIKPKVSETPAIPAPTPAQAPVVATPAPVQPLAKPQPEAPAFVPPPVPQAAQVPQVAQVQQDASAERSGSFDKLLSKLQDTAKPETKSAAGAAGIGFRGGEATSTSQPYGVAAGSAGMAGSFAGGMGGRIAAYAPPAIPEPVPHYYQDEGRDKFEDIKANPVKVTKEDPVSTFSIDVDTASYAFIRGALNNNRLPQQDAVRIEEMINYFPYAYAAPESREVPFKANVAVFATPWNKDTKLLRIGIKGYKVAAKHKPHANLVFLIDTSGSMNHPNKLPLVQNSLKLLLDTLAEDDTVSIVTYAGRAGTALEPTKLAEKAKIIAAIDALGAGGSTAGAEGIRQAYQLAEQNFDKEGINRVLLATDGDFNVGITNPEELKSFIERKRESGIFLSVLGFGQGNYNDALMQTLAQNGNGNAAYIDTLNEARKTLVEEASSTLFPIAKDVKIQVEFNPARVAEYQLIGYETRMLKREDFNNDKVDAGDIGSGHTVTALYEITPIGSKAKQIDDLRYGRVEEKTSGDSDEYAFVKIRYKQPDGEISKLITTPVDPSVEGEPDSEAKFATTVAAFGALLRGDGKVKDFTYDDVIALAQSAKGEDPFGYRAEFINLVRLAKNAPAMQPQGQ